MGDIFLKTLNMSIAASWLILAVVLLRFVLKKAPKWIVVLLWGIVALRLVVPFSFESALSLIPSAETFNAHNIQYETPAISSGIPAINNAVNPVLGETFAPNPAGSVNPLYGWTLVVSVIWFIGIAAMLLYAVISYVRVRRSVAERAPYEENIFLCDHVKSPFILGLVRPKIYLPSDMDTMAMEPVIAHEKAHLARHDHWWKPLGFLILTVHWFNPLCWIAYVLLCRDIELACDEKVIRQMDLEGKKQYSTALLECNTQRRLVTICPLAFGEVGVKERVKNVLNYKKPAFWLIVAAVIACAVVTVCFATNPTRSQEICVDGALYVQSGDTINELPDGSSEIGTLKSVLHHTNEHPTEHLSSANLNEKYAGCPVYQSGAQKDVIYLEDFAGFYIPFVCDSQVTDITPTQEPAPASITLGVSDLDAIFTSLDISNATMTAYGEKVNTCSAGIAIRAESYLAKLRDYTWEEYQVPDGWEENEGYRCQITAPGMTLTAFQSGYADARPLHVETDSGEGWFTLPYIEGEQVDWMIYDTFAGWYREAQAATLYGGEGIPLTAEELDWFQGYTMPSLDKTWGGVTEATAVSCFFTSQYNDPRDMDAEKFLAYCPDQGTLGPVDEAEFQLVQTRLDWRSGEDNHLFTVDELPVPCHRLPRTYINEILTQYAGITLEEMHTDWKEEAFYISETDCFYTFTSDFGPGSFLPFFGEKSGDLVTLWDGAGDVLTLQSVDDSYRILSHKSSIDQ